MVLLAAGLLAACDMSQTGQCLRIARRGRPLPDRCDFSLEDISHADLSGTDLREVDFGSATMVGVDLTGADLTRADLALADLTGARMSGAQLEGADLRWATLDRADLTDADLTDADLTDADLTGAILTGAIFRGVAVSEIADWSSVDFSAADLTGAVSAVEVLAASVCRGEGAAGAAPYQPEDQPNLLLLLEVGKEGVTKVEDGTRIESEEGVVGIHEWTYAVPPEWRSENIADIELVICATPQYSLTYARCEYAGNVTTPTIRYAVELTAREARTGDVIEMRTFEGRGEGCPALWDGRTLVGPRLEFADVSDWVAALAGR